MYSVIVVSGECGFVVKICLLCVVDLFFVMVKYEVSCCLCGVELCVVLFFGIIEDELVVI